MSWNTITPEAVLEEFTPSEAATLKAIQNAQEILPNVLIRVVTTVRGKIVAGGTPLGATGTVPDQLMTEVIDLARWRWLVSFPQLRVLQTKDRKDAYDAAMKRLERIESGELKVEDPNSAPGTPSANYPKPSFPIRTRKFSSEDEDGI